MFLKNLKIRNFGVRAILWVPFVLGVGTVTGPAGAQTSDTPSGTFKVAVIDVQRILLDSKLGKDVVADLKQLKEQKEAEALGYQEEITTLRDRITGGRLSLSDDRLSEMEQELEQKVIQYRRFQDDAERELQKKQGETFSKVETEVMPIIVEIGQQNQYTIIFNKFQSGLLFASDEIDITDLVIQQFDQVRAEGN